jgi:NAD(P)H-flavin reductase
VTTAAVARPAAGTTLPRPFRVASRRRDTSDTFTLALEPLDGEPLRFAAGQFTMLSAFGAGEVPISISGDPTRSGQLLHTIRDVGAVTHALVSVSRGDILGVRGPFGRGWDVSDGIGGDVVIVAGGIGLAPLRPAVLEVLSRRSDYRRVVLLYGTRSPEDVLFDRDLESWRGRFDLEVELTVDYGPPDWRGRVGLVTTLISRAGFDPSRTLALACGPEVMMRRVATGLVDRGVPRDRVRLSLERNMVCGIGLCGHCQLREVFVCLEGPVLGYDRAEALMDVREV